MGASVGDGFMVLLPRLADGLESFLGGSSTSAASTFAPTGARSGVVSGRPTVEPPATRQALRAAEQSDRPPGGCAAPFSVPLLVALGRTAGSSAPAVPRFPSSSAESSSGARCRTGIRTRGTRYTNRLTFAAGRKHAALEGGAVGLYVRNHAEREPELIVEFAASGVFRGGHVDPPPKKACTGAAVLYPARPGRAQSGPYAHDSLESIRRSAIGPAFLYKKKRAVVFTDPRCRSFWFAPALCVAASGVAGGCLQLTGCYLAQAGARGVQAREITQQQRKRRRPRRNDSSDGDDPPPSSSMSPSDSGAENVSFWRSGTVRGAVRWSRAIDAQASLVVFGRDRASGRHTRPCQASWPRPSAAAGAAPALEFWQPHRPSSPQENPSTGNWAVPGRAPCKEAGGRACLPAAEIPCALPARHPKLTHLRPFRALTNEYGGFWRV